jgi:hydroxymethylbilane synthase
LSNYDGTGVTDESTLKLAIEASHATLRIGTRGSMLARTQTEWVAGKLRALGHSVSIEIITTTGDTRTDVAVVGIGGDGVFVRELERALVERRIDVAVHSLKDLPTAETPGLDLASVPRRATPFDALVGRAGQTLAALPRGAVVGTSSVRRTLQIRLLRPDVLVQDPGRGTLAVPSVDLVQEWGGTVRSTALPAAEATAAA